MPVGCLTLARPSGTTLCFTSAIQSRARFLSLIIERDLFGNIRLVRNWGAVGTRCQEKVDIFPALYRVNTDERALSGVRLGLA